MKKIMMCVLVSGFLISSASAQTVKEKIDKAHKDPKAKENAAKADVHVVDKKKIVDSTVVKQQTIASKEVKKKKKAKKKA